jgi:transcriptional regulator with XRE-family HTH domain
MTNTGLNEWRVGRGYTQVALAEALGVDPLTISRWELGVRAIPVLLPLALKGLLFTHGEHCRCAMCWERYEREESDRDPRRTNPLGTAFPRRD